MTQACDVTGASPAAMRHCGLGIASFVIALAIALLQFATVLAAGMLEVSTPGGINQRHPLSILVGCFILSGVAVNLVGLGLGIAGLFQRSRKRLFAVLGTVLNLLLIGGVCLLIFIGLAAKQRAAGWGPDWTHRTKVINVRLPCIPCSPDAAEKP